VLNASRVHKGEEATPLLYNLTKTQILLNVLFKSVNGLQNYKRRSDAGVWWHSLHPSTQKAEAGGPQIQGQAVLHSKILSQNRYRERERGYSTNVYTVEPNWNLRASQYLF
jgi:hypothetical protein